MPIRKTTRRRKKVNYLAMADGRQQSGDEESDNEVMASQSTVLEPTDEQKVIDDEITQLKAKKVILEEEQHIVERLRLRDTLRQQCLTLEESIRVPQRTSPPQGQLSTQHTNKSKELSLPVNDSDNNDGEITVRELRNLTRLSDEADAQLNRYGLQAPQRPQQSEATNEILHDNGKNDDNYMFSQQNQLSSRGPDRMLVSGRETRVKDTVIKQLQWPHTMLEFSYASSDIPYEKLDPALLVAGELGVILNSGPEEHTARIKLLQKIMYYSKDYTWLATRSVHEAIPLEIERGVREWKDHDYRDIESAMLYRHPIQPQTSNKVQYQQKQPSQGRRFFCLDFNRSRCQHTGSHDAQVGSSIQNVEHFCAACWRRGRQIREHPESSDECPHRRR